MFVITYKHLYSVEKTESQEWLVIIEKYKKLRMTHDSL